MTVKLDVFAFSIQQWTFHRPARIFPDLGWTQLAHSWKQLARQMHLRPEGLFWVIFTVICLIANVIAFTRLYRKIRQEGEERQRVATKESSLHTATQQDCEDVQAIRKEPFSYLKEPTESA